MGCCCCCFASPPSFLNLHGEQRSISRSSWRPVSDVTFDTLSQTVFIVVVPTPVSAIGCRERNCIGIQSHHNSSADGHGGKSTGVSDQSHSAKSRARAQVRELRDRSNEPSSREPFPKTPTQLPTLSQPCRKQILHKPCSYNPEKPKKQDYFQRRN